MEKFDKIDILKLRKLVDEAANVVITTHMSPDGDALGSSLALVHVLSQMGKDAKIVVPDEPTHQLNFLPGYRDIIVFCRYKDFAEGVISRADLLFCLDYNALHRIDRVADSVREAAVPKVMIDHHLEPEPFCNITISRPEASSTCLVLYKVLCALELFPAINRDAAECLLTGMMTDTGNFSYNANDPEIYDATAHLIRCGADHNRLSKLIFDTSTANCLRLNAYAVAEKMEVWEGLGAALITLTREELNEYGYKPGYTEGLVNKPLAIPKVKYSAFLREESNYVKVSMRSKDAFPCDIICSSYFNGGGHRNAAGGEFQGTLKEAVDKFKSLLNENHEKYLKK